MNISELQKCANCGACYNACTRGAISIKTDGLFYTPTVESNLCVDCSLCTRVCPVNITYKSNLPIYACAGWSKDKRVVVSSSSGGVFYGIAQSILDEDGVIFSAVYSEDYINVEFASSDDVPLSRMLKSKYVESLVGLSFQRIKNVLNSGRKVMFCGTPCQVAGLQRYLNKEYENLILCDFACGGLPSHTIYQEYIRELENKYHSLVEDVDFRPKTFGWKRYAVRVKFKNRKEYIRLGTEDPYLRGFLYGKYTVRDYCLECKFPECHASDITIADFWLHEKLSSLKHEEGISLILCNTEKGKCIIDSIRGEYVFSELDVEKASYNNRIQLSPEKKKKHDAFLSHYEEYGFTSACQKFMPSSRKDKIRNMIIRKFFRKTRMLP